MEKLTYKEISDLIKQNEWGDDFVIGLGTDDEFMVEEDSDYVLSFGSIKRVESGGFDSDSYYSSVKVYRVYHFIEHGVFIRFTGWLESYDGCQFEEMEQVQPVEKTVTVYETINI